MSTPRPTPATAAPKCQATWWNWVEKDGQRTKVHHLCGRPAGHTTWHTCQFHAPVDRMQSGARVTEGTPHG